MNHPVFSVKFNIYIIWLAGAIAMLMTSRIVFAENIITMNQCKMKPEITLGSAGNGVLQKIYKELLQTDKIQGKNTSYVLFLIRSDTESKSYVCDNTKCYRATDKLAFSPTKPDQNWELSKKQFQLSLLPTHTPLFSVKIQEDNNNCTDGISGTYQFAQEEVLIEKFLATTKKLLSAPDPTPAKPPQPPIEVKLKEAMPHLNDGNSKSVSDFLTAFDSNLDNLLKLEKEKAKKFDSTDIEFINKLDFAKLKKITADKINNLNLELSEIISSEKFNGTDPSKLKILTADILNQLDPNHPAPRQDLLNIVTGGLGVVILLLVVALLFKTKPSQPRTSDNQDLQALLAACQKLDADIKQHSQLFADIEPHLTAFNAYLSKDAPDDLYKAIIAPLTTEITRFESSFKGIETSGGFVRDIVTSFSKTVDAFSGKINDFISAVNEANRKLAQVQGYHANNDELQQKNEELAGQLADSKNKANTLENEIAKLRLDIKTKDGLIDADKLEKEELESEKKELLKAKQDFSQRLDKLQEEQESTSKELSGLRTQKENSDKIANNALTIFRKQLALFIHKGYIQDNVIPSDISDEQEYFKDIVQRDDSECLKRFNEVLDYFKNEDPAWEAISDLLYFYNYWMHNENFVNSALYPLCGFADIRPDNPNAKLYESDLLSKKPFLIAADDVDPFDKKEIRKTYLINIFAKVIAPVLRARALLAAYYHNGEKTVSGQAIIALNSGFLAILNEAGIHPYDNINLLKPPEPDGATYKSMGGLGEPRSFKENSIINEVLKKTFEKEERVVTDIQTWGYSVDGKPELGIKSTVHRRTRDERDRAS